MRHLYLPGALEEVCPGWTALRRGYDAGRDRARFWAERGMDGTRLAVIEDVWGTPMAEGVLDCPVHRRLTGPDGQIIYLDRILLDGAFAGDLPSAPLEDGVSYLVAEGGPGPWADAGAEGPETGPVYRDNSVVPCFASGTSVMSVDGMVPVDWLRPGDKLMTRDRGFQPLLWIGRFAPEPGIAPPLPDSLAPVEIAPGALGPGLPSELLRVSPQHRLLIRDPQLALYFGHEAMFARAGALAGWPGIRLRVDLAPVVYYHLLLPRHEVVLADGLWTESLFLGDLTQEIVAPEQIAALARRAEVADGGHRQTAYPCLEDWEIALLAPAGRFRADEDPEEAGEDGSRESA